MTDYEKFETAFIAALTWSEGFDEYDLTEEALVDCQADCHSFWRRFGCYVMTDLCKQDISDPAEQAGYDFALTRNGHGAGFWDGDWPKPYDDMLTIGANNYGELHLDLIGGELHTC